MVWHKRPFPSIILVIFMVFDGLALRFHSMIPACSCIAILEILLATEPSFEIFVLARYYFLTLFHLFSNLFLGLLNVRLLIVIYKIAQ